MRFLRVLTNSLISGFFFSLLLALLLADLNINLAFKLPVLFKLAIFLMLSYGLLATLLCVFVTSVYRFFTGKKSPADYISPSFLTLSFSLLTLVYLVIFRENFAYFLSFWTPMIVPWMPPVVMMRSPDFRLFTISWCLFCFLRWGMMIRR